MSAYRVVVLSTWVATPTMVTATSGMGQSITASTHPLARSAAGTSTTSLCRTMDGAAATTAMEPKDPGGAITSATWVAVAKVDPGEMQCTGLAACKDHFCNQNSDILARHKRLVISHLNTCSDALQECGAGTIVSNVCKRQLAKSARASLVMSRLS